VTNILFNPRKLVNFYELLTVVCLFHTDCILTSDYVQTVFMPLQPIGDYWLKIGLRH